MDLKKQREQLLQARIALDETDGSLEHSNQVMRKIFQRYSDMFPVDTDFMHVEWPSTRPSMSPS